VFSHLRYVASIARGFTGYGLPLADLIQEGNVGLMKAVKRFDPGRDVRLVSFAVHWIKAEIYEYVVRNWRMVKVATTKAQRKLFFNLRKNRNRLGWMRQDEIDAMAEDLNVDTSTVREMEGRMTGADIAFDVDTTDDDEKTFWAPSETLGDYSADPGTLTLKADEARVRQQQLDTALAVLDERSRDIIQSRWLAESGKKTTLGDLAEQYGVSAERIRQIEKRSLKQMYSAVST
jgi:RNA polymerase sigma-32 factor